MMKKLVRASALLLCVISVFTMADAGQFAGKIWEVDVDQRLPNDPLALSSPVVSQHDGQLWPVLAGRDGWVHVYDLNTGEEVRRFNLGAASDAACLSLSNGNIVVGDVRGRIYVVDPVAGKVVWKKQLIASFTSKPVRIGDDFIVQTTDNAIYRFSESGEKRWSFSGSNNSLSMYLGAAPLVVDDKVYAVFTNGDAVALKAYSGDLIWKRQLLLSNSSYSLSDLQAPIAQPILLPKLSLGGENSKNVLLVPFFQGELIALSAADGAQLFSLPMSLKSSPKVLENTIYMADSSGYLHAYHMKKGNRLWSKKISGSALMGPVVWEDSLWLTNLKGELYRVNKNGDVQGTVGFPGGIARLPEPTPNGLLVRTDRGVMALVH